MPKHAGQEDEKGTSIADKEQEKLRQEHGRSTPGKQTPTKDEIGQHPHGWNQQMEGDGNDDLRQRHEAAITAQPPARHHSAGCGDAESG